MAAACNGAVRANNEDRSLIRKLSRAARAGEIPTGIPSWRVGKGIRVVHLPDDDHRTRLLGDRQRIAGTKVDIVRGAFEAFAVRAEMNHQASGDWGVAEPFKHALRRRYGGLLQ